MWNLQLYYNNTWIDILPKSNNLSWSSDQDSLGIELTFDTLYDIPEGSLLVLYKDSDLVMNGIIIKKSKKSNETYSYSLLDYGFYLNSNKVIKQFNNTEASKCINQLCDELGIKYNIAYMPTNITKIYSDTPASIMDDILDQVFNETSIKYIKHMDGDTFKIEKLGDNKVIAKYIIGKDVTINGSIEKLKNSVIVTSSEGENHDIIAKVKDDSSIAKYGLLQDVITVDNKNLSNAYVIANNYLKDNNKISKDMSINLLGLENSHNIKANRLIFLDIKDFNINGWYKVKSVNNNVTNDIHKLSVTIEF